MPPPEAFERAVRRLLEHERPGLRLAQLAFLVPVAADVVTHLLTASPGTLPHDGAYGAGLLVISVATCLVVIVGDMVPPPVGSILLPVLDMVGVAVMRTSPASYVGVALAFPAVWLALQYRARGVLVGTGASLFAIALPLLINGVTLEQVSRSLQLLLLVVMASLLVAASVEAWVRHGANADSARHEAEAAVAALVGQRRLQDALVRSVDVGLVSLDRDGCYSSINPRHRAFMDLAFPEGHAGRAGQLGYVYAADGTTLLTKEDMPTHRASQGEEFEDYLIWVGQADFERRALAVSARAVRDEKGDFDGAVLAYHDVTDLIQALKVKDEFVAAVSHELRTPLTSIMGYLAVVMEDVDGLPDEAKNYLSVARRNSDRLLHLVTDLLQTAQHRSGIVVESQPLFLGRLVTDVVAKARERATEAGVTLTCEVSRPAPMTGDSGRLEQVLENLLSNALKYTPPGGEVSVRLDVERDHAVVRCSDTGFGIPERDLDQVFGRFYRSSDANEMAIPGVGLGLAICKEIVEAHGGSIRVASQLGVGSLFEVRLPLTPVARHAGVA